MSVNAKQSLTGTVGTGTKNIYSYYTPEITQPDENTMRMEYIPSERNMPIIDPVELTLPKGKDGYTPQKGIDYFDGKDGTNGRDGVDGKDGYTPRKGIDYFTDNDVSQITEVVVGDVMTDYIPRVVASGGVGHVSYFGDVLAELELTPYDEYTAYASNADYAPILVEGYAYDVTTDSGVFQSECRTFEIDGVGLVCWIGNFALLDGGDNTGETYLYAEVCNGIYNERVFLDVTKGTKAIISAAEDIIYPIKPMFLPVDVESLATKDYVEELITGAIGGAY